MNRIAVDLQKRIVSERKQGKSIPEISKELHISKTTVQRYVQSVRVTGKNLRRLKERQGGSKERAAALRENIMLEVAQHIGSLSVRDRQMLLFGLYWGEGTKRDFGLINSDPKLIQTFIASLSTLGITKSRLSLSIRVHEGINIAETKSYWSKVTAIPESRINFVEIIQGNKKGKLPYGMCRVRVTNGIRERLYVQLAIDWVGKDAHKRVLST